MTYMENGKTESIVALMKGAQSTYIKEVAEGKKVYSRYVKDFLNGHRYCGSWDVRVMNQYRKDMGIIEDLLETRPDLVQKYFCQESMDEEDVEALIRELNTTSAPDTSSADSYKTTRWVSAFIVNQKEYGVCKKKRLMKSLYGSDTGKGAGTSSLQLLRREGLLGIIVEAMNQFRLFKEKVTEAEIKGFFCCSLKSPLVARNNRELAFFFDKLCENGLISKQWQDVVSTHRLLLSSTGKNMKASDLSSAACKARLSDRSIFANIKSKVKEIAEWAKSAGKDRI